MAVRIKEMKTDLVGELMTTDELDNYMFNHGLSLIESDSSDDEEGKVNEDNFETFKYITDKNQIWVEVERDEQLILVTAIKYVNKVKGKETKGEPFHSFEDYDRLISAIKETKNYDYWLACTLMAGMGKRVGDTLSFKWSDLILTNGEYRNKLVGFADEKTDKNVHTRINDYVILCVNEYLQLTNTNPLEHYNEKIFKRGYKSLYRAFTDTVKNLCYAYPVTIHSFRKYHGNMLYKLHPQDADNLTIVQMTFGHSDPVISKDYIGYIDEKIDKYNQDLGDFFVKCSNNETPEIDRTPLATIRTTKLRELLLRAYNSCKEGVAPEDMLNQLYAEVETQKM